jgi:hypothetical protein
MRKEERVRKTVPYFLQILVFAVFAANLQAEDLLKVTVVNNSDDYSDDQVYVQMVGTDPNGSGQLGYVNLDTSAWTASALSDNTVTAPGGPWPYKFTDYSKKLTELKSEGPHTWSFQMPHIISGRVYISFEKPAYFHVNAGPALAYPSALNSNLPNYSIVFDKIELDWQNGQLPFMNTTTVDFFSISFKLELKDSGTSLGQAGFTKTRKAIIDELTALASPWQNCVVKNSGDAVVRFVAPQLLSDPNPFANYFDSYINDIYTYYKTNILTLSNLPDVETWSATGQVDGSGVFTFTVDGTGETVTIDNLVGQGKHIFGCDGAGYLFTTGSDSIQRQGIIRQMGAALNRSVLYNIKDSSTWWGDPANFYNQTITNHYSKILHEGAYNGYCYGFPYDDVGHYDTGITGNATEAIITIQSMSAGGSPSGQSYPIDLTLNKSTFSATDTISVTANIEQVSTRFYPAIWIETPGGQNLYYERGKGFHSSPTPYLGMTPVVVNSPISGYPIATNVRFRAAPGIYYINAAAVDAAQTTSASNIVYIDDVDRVQATVQ